MPKTLEHYRQIDLHTLNWRTSFRSPITKRQIPQDAEPLEIGKADAPSLSHRKGPSYTILDARGPIPLNLRSISERAGEDNGMYKMVDVRAVVMTREGTLGTPTKEYYQKWLPGKVTEEYDGEIKPGTRPWITLHPVYNLMLTLKAKERRTHIFETRILSIEIELSDTITCVQTDSNDRHTWRLELKCENKKGIQSMSVNVNTRGTWDEIAEAVVY